MLSCPCVDTFSAGPACTRLALVKIKLFLCMAVVILMAKIPGRKCLLDPRAKEQNRPPTTHFQDSALGEASLGVFTCPSVSEPFHLDSLQPTSTLVRRGPGHHRLGPIRLLKRRSSTKSFSGWRLPSYSGY